MNGFFDIKLLDTDEMSSSEVSDYVKSYGTNALIDKVGIKEHYFGNNRIFDAIPAYFLDILFSLPNSKAPLYYPIFEYPYCNDNCGLLSFLNISNLDSDTTSYTEFQHTQYGGIHAVPNSVNSTNASKFFIAGGLGYSVYSDNDSIVYRDGFMWLPLQLVSNSIRSIAVYIRTNSGSGYLQVAKIARIRIKDADGNSVTISKSNKQTLLLEYRLTLYSS